MNYKLKMALVFIRKTQMLEYTQVYEGGMSDTNLLDRLINNTEGVRNLKLDELGNVSNNTL